MALGGGRGCVSDQLPQPSTTQPLHPERPYHRSGRSSDTTEPIWHIRSLAAGLVWVALSIGDHTLVWSAKVQTEGGRVAGSPPLQNPHQPVHALYAQV